MYWGKGLSNDDHCHATDKETKWKTLRQAFKCKNLPASYPGKHPNVVYTTPSPRHHEYYEEYTCTLEENDGGYFEPNEEATVCVRNLPYDFDSEDLAQLFIYAGVVVFSEVSLPSSSLSLSGHAAILPQFLIFIGNVCKS
jgi:hypothetical protein